MADRYATRLEELIVKHNLIERIGEINEKGKSVRWTQNAMNKVDRESMQYMIAAEKKCRKIRSGVIPFSPEAVRWIRRIQVYRALLQWRAGRRKNMGNLKRLARRVGISEPFQKSVIELNLRLKACLAKCECLTEEIGLESSSSVSPRAVSRGFTERGFLHGREDSGINQKGTGPGFLGKDEVCYGKKERGERVDGTSRTVEWDS